MRITPPAYALLAALVAATPAAAAAAGLGAPEGGYSIEYTGYSHGFVVIKLAATLSLAPSGYAAHVTFHTAGVAGWVVHADNDSTVTGTFQEGRAMPTLFAGTGHLRGQARLTRIAYKGGNPVIEALQPPVEHERSLVPPADTQHTIDTLSAVALLIHTVAVGGGCEGSTKTFDGRRLAEQTAHTTGPETLPETGRSIFHGTTLRCDFDGRQLGGFVNNENEDDLRKPRHGTAWLAPLLAGAPPVPVRVIFENKLLGQVTLYLTAAKATEPPHS